MILLSDIKYAFTITVGRLLADSFWTICMETFTEPIIMFNLAINTSVSEGYNCIHVAKVYYCGES